PTSPLDFPGELIFGNYYAAGMVGIGARGQDGCGPRPTSYPTSVVGHFVVDAIPFACFAQLISRAASDGRQAALRGTRGTHEPFHERHHPEGNLRLLPQDRTRGIDLRAPC